MDERRATASAVPFVGLSLPLRLRVCEGFMGCPNWHTEKSNLDKTEVQTSPSDRPRARSSGLGLKLKLSGGLARYNHRHVDLSFWLGPKSSQ
jgi:hypothetical protein